MHHRHAREGAGVGGEELRGEVVASLDDQVVGADELHRVVRQEARVVDAHVHAWREPLERALCRGGLLDSHVGVVEEDLPVEVRALDHVVVGEPERAHAGAGQHHRRGASEASDADEEDLRRAPLHGAASLGKNSSRLK